MGQLLKFAAKPLRCSACGCEHWVVLLDQADEVSGLACANDGCFEVIRFDEEEFEFEVEMEDDDE